MLIRYFFSFWATSKSISSIESLHRSCILLEIFFIMRQVELVQRKEFVATAFNLDNKTFVIYIVFFACFNLDLEVYLFCKALIAYLKAYETFTSIFSK